VVTLAAIALEIVQPFPTLVGLLPPLAFLAFVPGLVRDLLLSSPAIFAFVVVWRVRRLRDSDSESWPDRTSVDDFGGRLFDAGALPVAVAAVVLAIGQQLVHAAIAVQVLPEGSPPGLDAVAGLAVEGGALGPARTILTVALVAGILSVHRTFGTGLGKLIGAGFFVWGMHLAIGFSVPWMTSWIAYLPVIGQYAPQRSVGAVLLAFDVAVACAAWMAAREKCRTAPLWSDVRADPPPSPPAPSAADHDSSHR
jgi:hypothetical protein